MFQWNGGMLTGRVSMPIGETIAALTTVHFCAVCHAWWSTRIPGGFSWPKFPSNIWANCNYMDPDAPSLFQNRRMVEEDPWFYKAWDGMHILYSHEAVWPSLLHVSKECAFHLRLCKTSDLLRKPKIPRALWCLCQRHQRFLAVCFYGHIALKFNTMPPTWMVPGWEAVGTTSSFVSRHLPLLHARDALQQESRVLQKLLQCYWMKIVDPFARSKLTLSDRKSQKIPCRRGMFGSVFWNWKHYQVQCVTSL